MKGGVLSEQGKITRGRGVSPASPHKPGRSKTKRGAKPDGYKTQAKCRKKRGVKRQRKVGGGSRPEIQDAKKLWNVSGGRSRFLRQAETATPLVAQPLRLGRERAVGGQPETGVPRAEAPLLSSAELAVAALGLYTLRL
jgi:hypothetical protein